MCRAEDVLCAGEQACFVQGGGRALRRAEGVPCAGQWACFVQGSGREGAQGSAGPSRGSMDFKQEQSLYLQACSEGSLNLQACREGGMCGAQGSTRTKQGQRQTSGKRVGAPSAWRVIETGSKREAEGGEGQRSVCVLPPPASHYETSFVWQAVRGWPEASRALQVSCACAAAPVRPMGAVAAHSPAPPDPHLSAAIALSFSTSGPCCTASEVSSVTTRPPSRPAHGGARTHAQHLRSCHSFSLYLR